MLKGFLFALYFFTRYSSVLVTCPSCKFKLCWHLV